MYRNLLTLAIFLFGFGWTCLAAESKAELLFAINAALKTGDKNYFERSFAFENASPAARGEVKAIIDEILRWANPIVSTSERDTTTTEAAPKLNGTWTFQIHIHKGPPPSSAYVFPAGPVSPNDYRILLLAK